MAKKEFHQLAQEIIRQYRDYRSKRLSYDEASRGIKKEEDRCKEIIMRALKANMKIEPGQFVPLIKMGKRYPRWAEEFKRACGEKAYEEILNSTPFNEELEIIENVKDEQIDFA